MKLTESEIQIMDLFWNTEKALTGQEILELSPEDKFWKDKSIFIMLQTLLKKDAIRETGAVKCSSGKYQRVFKPTLSREDYYGAMFADGIGEESMPQVFAALLDRSKLSKSTLSELKEIIAAKIKEL